MNPRRRRHAKRRRQAARAFIGQHRLWMHHVRAGRTCFIDQLSSGAPEAYVVYPGGLQVRLW